LVHYQDDGAMGLVVNRRTKTAISRVLSGDEAKGRADPIYIGGPVETTLVTALARSSADLAGAERIFGDVYAISARALLSKSLASPIAASAFHAYLGYAGWSAPQLRHEMELGSWYIFPGDAGTVFDADPGSVWNRLIERTDTRIATIAHPPYAPR
jgi:putative transcriptional regulator